MQIKKNKNNISSSLPLTHLIVIYKPQIELLWGVRVCVSVCDGLHLHGE